jgi:hypothetical protein
MLIRTCELRMYYNYVTYLLSKLLAVIVFREARAMIAAGNIPPNARVQNCLY